MSNKIPDHVKDSLPDIAEENMKDAGVLLEDVEVYNRRLQEAVRAGAEWFHGMEGTLLEREVAIRGVQNYLDVEHRFAANILSSLVGDRVDPVVQIMSDEKHVGVIEYEEFEGAYGYVNYDDRLGRHRRAVCAQCVHEERTDDDIAVADAGKSHPDDATYDELVDAIHDHYDEAHDAMPENVETGATLLSGTTIGGNISWHAGNDGSGSGLDADTVDGQQAADITGYYVNDATLHEFDVSFGNSSELYADGSEYTAQNISGTWETLTTVTIDINQFGHALLAYNYKVTDGTADFRVREQGTGTLVGPGVNDISNTTYTRTNSDKSTDAISVTEFSGSTTFEIQVKSGGGAATSNDASITNIGAYRPQSSTEIN